jgi:hypothetical protein
MNKPQVNINLNIDFEKMDNGSEGEAVATIESVVSHVKLLQEELSLRAVQETCKEEKQALINTSRHHQSVAANTRIMDAIEFINKEMRLLKGQSESGNLKVFEELKSILLGI